MAQLDREDYALSLVSMIRLCGAITGWLTLAFNLNLELNTSLADTTKILNAIECGNKTDT